ncbi:hypothetical protein BK011_07130 [Tenericutes bacterium MZ-XQ]|jgi:hypothetical protein|nr:hypothetical protein BK011_07130 [Tenericutes bacterium MZ-XQ]
MKRSNLEKYLLSITPLKTMFEKGIMTKQDYQKAESHLADKYCIKKGNLYRLIDLTIPLKRVIYSVSEEEVNHDKENSNKSKRVTQVSE